SPSPRRRRLGIVPLGAGDSASSPSASPSEDATGDEIPPWVGANLIPWAVGALAAIGVGAALRATRNRPGQALDGPPRRGVGEAIAARAEDGFGDGSGSAARRVLLFRASTDSNV
ncbi:MAG: hypothetical protein LBG60_03260, partial [Bifidobacteriaceae bacterium]|nr:hypothetical protein [Bifidobacteriaceae bacterium]